ncbi:hypothetical protein TMatcc_006904 [Talaromyces marneffei ATCC 18224]|uniref:Ankyrin repeat-containing protein, putative n=1 Tax=Talaromyces marneffei (strain ATCC 18224 / CBS 334.59 / QM 7333) TaxID=441960 RepID=B6QDP6_TALMQ|nr:ankyrin repeat-containing protein, putative [Talaromyces marneffei ATCC 18224]KAE8553646.1 hypothetical protein EYB25_005028 [Talaromyces marneffei]
MCNLEVHLSLAIEAKDASRVSQLLDDGAPMNFELFAQATQNKCMEILQLFLDHGWDINTESSLDSLIPSALIYTFDDIELVKWFLLHGADPNKRCQMRDATPLSYAMYDASMDIIDRLFMHGGSTQQGQLLHYASMRKDENGIQVLRYLQERDPQMIRSRVNLLLDEGYPEFAQNCRFGACTPIQYAACAGALESVKFLVDQGANPWRMDMYKRTALSYAIHGGHEDVQQYLRTLA